jgi:hypothetical protein
MLANVPQEEQLIKDVAGVVYLAGSDTTVAAVTTYFMAALVHPDTQMRAQEELDRVVGRRRLPEFSDKADLPYLNAFMQECLRWLPVLPTGRSAVGFLGITGLKIVQVYHMQPPKMMSVAGISYPKALLFFLSNGRPDLVYLCQRSPTNFFAGDFFRILSLTLIPQHFLLSVTSSIYLMVPGKCAPMYQILESMPSASVDARVRGYTSLSRACSQLSRRYCTHLMLSVRGTAKARRLCQTFALPVACSLTCSRSHTSCVCEQTPMN